jgi:hypothetical protein
MLELFTGLMLELFMALILELLELFIINNLFILSNLWFQNFVVSIFHNGGSLNVGI